MKEKRLPPLGPTTELLEHRSHGLVAEEHFKAGARVHSNIMVGDYDRAARGRISPFSENLYHSGDRSNRCETWDEAQASKRADFDVIKLELTRRIHPCS